MSIFAKTNTIEIEGDKIEVKEMNIRQFVTVQRCAGDIEKNPMVVMEKIVDLLPVLHELVISVNGEKPTKEQFEEIKPTAIMKLFTKIMEVVNADAASFQSESD